MRVFASSDEYPLWMEIEPHELDQLRARTITSQAWLDAFRASTVAAGHDLADDVLREAAYDLATFALADADAGRRFGLTIPEGGPPEDLWLDNMEEHLGLPRSA